MLLISRDFRMPESVSQARAQGFRKCDTVKHYAKLICLFQCTEEVSVYTEPSPLISSPVTSSAQALTGQDFSPGCPHSTKGLSSCRDPGGDPSATLGRPGCVPEAHSPPTFLLRTGPCLSFIYVTVRPWLGSILAQNPSIRF